MTGILATTRATLLRGGAPDGLGDFIANDVAVDGAENVPCSLIERQRTVYDPASGASRVVRFIVARFVPGTFADPRVGDRVRDETTGLVRVVTEVRATPRTIAGAGALRLELVDVNNGEAVA